MPKILNRLLAEGRLREHRTSAREIADLIGLVERNLADASVDAISADRRFAIAYEAALQLATITLYSNGYETYGAGHHFSTFQALRETMGNAGRGYAEYFEMCRGKRKVTSYDRAGEISETEVESLLKEVRTFKAEVLAWLNKHHPGLAGEL
jgi:uncharacterized protein (UPF0332 family)